MTDVRDRAVDVVVVGGGPAGSATALWCVRRGLRVVLVERERFPRHRPGETLPPAAEVLFGQLGVAEVVSRAGFLRHEGTWAEWAGTRRFNAFGSDAAGPWRGFQAPRDRLDQLLLDAAIDAGIIVEQPVRAASVLFDAGKVTGIETPDLRISAVWVVDAGGGQHWLARQLGIPRRTMSPRLIARYGYARGQCPSRDDGPEIVADEAGWTWTAQIDADLYQWTRLSFTEDDPYRDRPPLVFDTLAPLPPVRGADVSWRIVERPAGPGYLCVGDAAAVLDPASSHGVLKALMSGMMAAHVIAENLCTGASASIAIRAYTTWITNQFNADVAALSELYHSLANPPAWVRQVSGVSSAVIPGGTRARGRS